MPWYAAEHRQTVGRDLHACFDALTEYEQFPRWQGPMRRCEVLERGPEGLATLVEYEVSTPFRRLSYRLTHSYEPPHRISGELHHGDIRGFFGEWLLEPIHDAATTVTYALRLDPGIWLPRRVIRVLHDRVMHRAVDDFKRHLEEASA